MIHINYDYSYSTSYDVIRQFRLSDLARKIIFRFSDEFVRESVSTYKRKWGHWNRKWAVYTATKSLRIYPTATDTYNFIAPKIKTEIRSFAPNVTNRLDRWIAWQNIFSPNTNFKSFKNVTNVKKNIKKPTPVVPDALSLVATKNSKKVSYCNSGTT